MRIIRHVPLGSALRAAVEAMNWADPSTDDTFRVWFNDHKVGHRRLIDCPSVTTDELAEILPQAPTTTPSGAAWKAAAEASLALTLADLDRPYDEVVYDTADELATIEAIEALAETLRETSPLLGIIADELDQQTPRPPVDLGDVASLRSRVTADGVLTGHRGHCEKHDDDCYGDTTRLVPWEHINALHPDAEPTVLGLLADLDAGLPAHVGDHDNGRARMELPTD